jgi:hypothetical protein
MNEKFVKNKHWVPNLSFTPEGAVEEIGPISVPIRNLNSNKPQMAADEEFIFVKPFDEDSIEKATKWIVKDFDGEEFLVRALDFTMYTKEQN